MPAEQSQSPFERILSASNRNHLDNPFRTSNELRSKHFPGAGGKLSHTKLAKAYLAEMADPDPDWQLLAHGTWPWVIGHAHDLAGLTAELEDRAKNGERPIDASSRANYVQSYSEAGTEEIDIFLRIFANGGSDFQKAVLEKLDDAPEPPPSATPAVAQSPSAAQPTPQPDPKRPDVDDLDPITRAKMAVIGTLFFFILSLIPLGIQFWRQPDQDHWIVVGISGILGLLTLIFAIDYARKKP